VVELPGGLATSADTNILQGVSELVRDSVETVSATLARAVAPFTNDIVSEQPIARAVWGRVPRF